MNSFSPERSFPSSATKPFSLSVTLVGSSVNSPHVFGALPFTHHMVLLCPVGSFRFVSFLFVGFVLSSRRQTCYAGFGFFALVLFYVYCGTRPRRRLVYSEHRSVADAFARTVVEVVVGVVVKVEVEIDSRNWFLLLWLKRGVPGIAAGAGTCRRRRCRRIRSRFRS